MLELWANGMAATPKPAGWLETEWRELADWDEIKRIAVDLAYMTTEASDADRADMRRSVEPLLARGLLRREGTCVQSPVETTGDLARPWAAWRMVKAAYRELGGDVRDVTVADVQDQDNPFSLLVCEVCTLVYRPKLRVAQSRFCMLCNNRPAAGALGHRELEALKRGEVVRIRRPASGSGRVVDSWGTARIRRCVECGELTFRLTCSDRCKSKHRRRAA